MSTPRQKKRPGATPLGRRVQAAPRASRSKAGCPIVGVGASAGGLEAFTQLLKHLPVDTGFGFVLVQHLDPLHESALTLLLARATAMPVREVTNRMRVEANHVYIIPPNTVLGIVRGVLVLQPRRNDRSAPRSIDFFFEALAKDQHERAIGVILSGSATDGTLGLEAIKAEGGLTFAQNETARYDSMPRSAVAAGCVDLVLSPGNIARELARIAKHPYVAGAAPASERRVHPRPEAAARKTPPGNPPPNETDGYGRILTLLRNHSGVDFSLYKTSTINRRITRRAVLSRCDTLEHYADFLRSNAKELDALYSDSLISVTSFFRNADAFAVLRQKVFGSLLQRRGDEPLRVWVLGCSTGQEAYSIAMTFAELADKIHRPCHLQMFATDLNDANLDKARHGLYPKSLAQDVSPERLRRFFVEEDGGYRVIKSLREQVVFARHNLISDPPFSRMDLISCRNLMIYLEPSLQKKAVPAFHYALKPDGFLFLGASESIGGFTDLFAPVDKKQKIFSKKATSTATFQLPVPSARSEHAHPGPRNHAANRERGGASQDFRTELNAEREADRVTVNQFAPPSVLIDAELQILQFRGPTGAFLEPPTGKARFDLLKMARDGLMLPLRTAINQAKKQNDTVRKDGVVIKVDGVTRTVNLEVVPLKNLKERRFLVLFEEAAAPAGPESAPAPRHPSHRKENSGRVAALEAELAETRDYLQSIQEHQEAANEELQAANEEGQSANEELQSLNEELETSKEEIESTNEELTTVNEEMVNRNNDLNRFNNDLTNLQTSTQLVIVLLARDLTIRRFSAQAEKQFHLVASDVGRPIGEVRHNLDLPDLNAVIEEVILSVHEREREVRDRNGRWYSLRVRPYVTLDHKVDGAVLVLLDITAGKEAAQEIARARDFAEAIISTARDPMLILDTDLKVQKANDAFLTTFRVAFGKIAGRSIFKLGRGHWDVPQLRKLIEDVLPRHSSFNNVEVTRRFESIGGRTMLLNARMLSQDPGHREKILLGIQDITERKQAEEALREARTQLAQHAEKLEELVAQRTKELTATNRQLKISVAESRKGREEFRALWLESQEMQKKLRRLTHQILTAQEEERKKISRDLHDEVVQALVGINVELSALVHGNSTQVRQVKDKVARTQRMVEKAVDSVHRFARGLRPSVLDDLGLIPALHAFCRSLAERKKIKINLTAFGGVEALDSDKRTVFYRVAQEALNNIARHARASRVDLTISRQPGALRLEIADNGKAFSVKRILLANNNKRLGLVGMKERVEMVGGTFTIESVRGQGTTVRADIPFTPGKKST